MEREGDEEEVGRWRTRVGGGGVLSGFVGMAEVAFRRSSKIMDNPDGRRISPWIPGCGRTFTAVTEGQRRDMVIKGNE